MIERLENIDEDEMVCLGRGEGVGCIIMKEMGFYRKGERVLNVLESPTSFPNWARGPKTNWAQGPAQTNSDIVQISN